MSKEESFRFRLSAADRDRLDRLARRLQRSRGDTLCRLIRLAAHALDAGADIDRFPELRP